MRTAHVMAALLAATEVTDGGQKWLPPTIDAVGALLAALLTAIFGLVTAVVTHVLARRAEREKADQALLAKEREVRFGMPSPSERALGGSALGGGIARQGL